MGSYAIVKGNIVDAIAIADGPLETDGTWICVDDVVPRPGPSWTYGNGVFSPPAPVPDPPKTYTRLQLINLLDSDYNTIITSSKTDVEVEVWLEKFRLQDAFVVSDANFIEDINFLVNKNLITQEKSNTILNG